MGNITRRTRMELKFLPLMLGKLAGGLAAVFGFAVAVVAITRTQSNSLMVILLSLSVTGAGIAVFLFSGRRLAVRSADTAEETPPADKNRTSELSWMLLLLFAVAFLISVYFMTR